jgi:hypothetical protein
MAKKTLGIYVHAWRTKLIFSYFDSAGLKYFLKGAGVMIGMTVSNDNPLNQNAGDS